MKKKRAAIKKVNSKSINILKVAVCSLIMLTFFLAIYLDFLIEDENLNFSPPLYSVPAPKVYIGFDNGTAVDLSGNDYVIRKDTNSWPVIRAIGNARNFRYDLQSYVYPIDSNSWQINDFTVSAWVWPNDPPGIYNSDLTIISKRSPSLTEEYPFDLVLNKDKKIVLSYSPSSSPVSLVSNNALLDNQWYFITATYDGSEARIYINGTLDNADSSLGGPLAQSDDYLGIGARIGSNTVYGQGFNGILDEIGFYESAFSSQDVSRLYTAQKQLLLRTDLVGSWTFNNEDCSDNSGNGNTCINNAQITSQGLYRAAEFDSSNSHIEFPTLPDNNYSNLSFVFWVKPNNLSNGNQLLLSKGSVSPFTISLGGGVNKGKVLVGYNFGTPNTLVSNSTISEDVWSLIALTYDKNQLRLYINGSLDRSQAASGSFIVNNAPLTLGNDGSNNFIGSIDEFYIYNTNISASDITNLFNSQNTVFNPPIFVNAPLNFAANSISQTSINLTWTDASNNEEGFILNTLNTSNFLLNSVNVNRNSNNYLVNGLSANTTYRFQLGAFNKTVSNYTSMLTVSTLAAPNYCIDSDGGLNYTTKGSSLLNINGTISNIFNDTCALSGISSTVVLTEAICVNGVPDDVEFSCPNGCSDGVCLPGPACTPTFQNLSTGCIAGDIIINYTVNLNSSCIGNLPANRTSRCDYEGNHLIGTFSEVTNNNFGSLSMRINGSDLSYSTIYTGRQRIDILENNNVTRVTLNYNFSNKDLIFSGITLKKQSASSSYGYIVVKGLSGFSKTVTLDKKNSNSNRVCILNTEDADTSFSSSCNRVNETLIDCDGISYNGFKCSVNNSYMIVEGLNNSAVREFVLTSNTNNDGDDDDIITPTSACTEADWISTLSPLSCPSSGIQLRTWTKIRDCFGGVSKALEPTSCSYIDNSGGETIDLTSTGGEESLDEDENTVIYAIAGVFSFFILVIILIIAYLLISGKKLKAEKDKKPLAGKDLGKSTITISS